MLNKQFSVTQENYTIAVAAQFVGPDLLLVITGGDHPHLGDVTVISSEDDMATLRLASHDGRKHKDNLVAERIAPQIKDNLPGKCVLTAGIHVDHISQAQIDASFTMADTLAQQINAWLEAQHFDIKPPVYYSNSEQPR
ncbi:hypothetical protein IV38_GL000844 [Lactobacillus selangorensis]|uniref:Prenylated flavin chaperone LpdD-like domain-containing protein n=1 Tax=Lactobacillus selangorensis TaxID=81857 RepID=A0A0R2FJ51_9LACO|nr:hypothetical protein [Lactobacillus selangorensis]KRN28643.1 hypothetical protein IV38_GL000844 [Lactobacillus selangorensis]KRN32947.1 hypothetical protein IV40_GL001009 [Lactobacillus selangorensis]